MANLQLSLQNIPSTYTVFEKDQVLTEAQLNAAVSYLDDQERLARITLVGVGIVAGLIPSLGTNQVTVTKGVGITTDGDLLYLPADTTYTQFKAYGADAPTYAPFGSGSTQIKAWELVAKGVTDASAAPLTGFAAQAGSTLDKWTVLLLAQTYLKSQDLCSGTDCDAMGQLAIHDVKVLVIPAASTTPFAETMVTADAAARKLDDVVAVRPVITGVVTVGDLTTAYKNANSAILTKLQTSLPKVFPACQSFLGDLFQSDPTAAWITKLQQILTQLATSGVGLQYGYDLLKDLVSTYEAFRDQLFGDTTVLCPDPGAFPKHLLLGDLSTPTTHRTGRYPSPAVTQRPLEHARFLFKKLGVLVNGFAVPTGTLQIQITPSMGEDRSLEERAMPYYYSTTGTSPIQDSWSWELSRRGMGAYNYSYYAGSSAYAAQGAAAAPLTSQIGRFPFFRIEGHLGAQLATAVSALQTLIKNNNLPIALHTVLLEKDKTKIIRWFPPRYWDIHRVHRLLRYGLADQLDAVSSYADSYTQQVASAGTNLKVDLDPDNVASLNATKAKGYAALASGTLRKAFADFEADPSWRGNVVSTQQSAGEMKVGLSDVVKTDYTTPVDSLFGSSHFQLIGYLDGILQNKQDNADDRQLLSTFLAKQPGLEHFAGVPRGCTFVLAYDTTGVVVADFMLPYWYDDTTDAEVEQPPAQKPPTIWDPSILGNAVSVGLPITSLINSQVNNYWNDHIPAIKQQISTQGTIFQMFSDAYAQAKIGTGQTAPKVADPYLNLLMQEMQTNNDKVSYLQARLLDPSLTQAMQQQTQAQLTAAENDLATSTTTTATYVQQQNLPVTQGTDGFTAMQAVAASAKAVSNPTALKSMQTALSGVQGAAGISASLKTMIGTIIGGGAT